jgi:hypothetical protein
MELVKWLAATELCGFLPDVPSKLILVTPQPIPPPGQKDPFQNACQASLEQEPAHTYKELIGHLTCPALGHD